MKYFHLSVLVLICACSPPAETPMTGLPVLPADSLIKQNAFIPEPVKLPGSWKANVAAKENQPATEWEIRFIDNGQYQSFYKPSNKKNGTWRLHSDTLALYTKAIDKFQVLALNDTLLKIKALDKWAYEYSFRKESPE